MSLGSTLIKLSKKRPQRCLYSHTTHTIHVPASTRDTMSGISQRGKISDLATPTKVPITSASQQQSRSGAGPARRDTSPQRLAPPDHQSNYTKAKALSDASAPTLEEVRKLRLLLAYQTFIELAQETSETFKGQPALRGQPNYREEWTHAARTMV